jgi:hypothetical protein
MPPKAKTPSEEAAMENPKLDQMLAMLQGMSEQISGLDLRMVAVEKKSDAAREAVDAIKRVDKGDSLENAREQNCGIRPQPYPSIKTLAKKAINDACGSARLLQPNSTTLTSALLFLLQQSRRRSSSARANNLCPLQKSFGGFHIIFIVATTTNQDQQPPLSDQPQQQRLSANTTGGLQRSHSAI